jgi:hypothetical protein
LNSSSTAARKIQESTADNQRRVLRLKAVLPVRVSANSSSASYSDLVHTLDISEAGVRLGSIRRTLEVGSQIVLQYRQHKAEFRVVWIRSLGSGDEKQIGLEADVQRDFWGLNAGAGSKTGAQAGHSGTASRNSSGRISRLVAALDSYPGITL